MQRTAKQLVQYLQANATHVVEPRKDPVSENGKSFYTVNGFYYGDFVRLAKCKTYQAAMDTYQDYLDQGLVAGTPYSK